MDKDIKKLVGKYLQIGRMMQVATVKNDQPWCCTVYFVPDEKLNLYWISTPDRRHSQEILKNKKIAAAISIKHIPDEDVVGLQVEGDAQLVEDSEEIKKAIRLYADRHNRGEKWYEDFLTGKNQHKLYRIKPRLFVLFDEENFPNDPRKEWKL